MPLAKFDRKKIIHWLSPLLVLSLGIHGLVLLVPISEKADPEEDPEPELLEPIQVSTLPPLPEAATEQPSIADLPPENSEQSVPEPVQTAQPAPAAPPPAPQNMPRPQPSPTANTSAPAATSTAKPSKLPPGTPQPNVTAGTVQEAYDASIQFGIDYGVIPKQINAPLTLTYPAGGRCYDKGTTAAADMAIAINKGGGVEGGKVVKNSIYPDIDEWIEDTLLFDLPSYAFADLPDAQGTTIVDWLYEAYFKPENKPMVPKDEEKAAYSFPVTVNIEDNNC